MSRFNLLEENWISVIVDENGRSKEVSLLDFFENSHNYIAISGQTKTQDFALMRVFLAVLHTVFSRFDAYGKKYACIELDDRYFQINEIEDEDEYKYDSNLFETWKNLWNRGSFPKIVTDYLLKWKDHFYLFDDRYPFFQVLEDDISGDNIKSKSAGKIYGKNMNRTITESENKIALFSPKYSANSNKDILTYQELARWLISLQSYFGLADKTVFNKDKYKTSKGRAYDLGGVYFEGKNIFETLMLNLVLDNSKFSTIYTKNKKQKPSWEYSGKENIERYFTENNPDNLSQLYTNWARAIYIDQDTDIKKAFSLQVVKLPDLDHKDYFLEPMTIWKFNKEGENRQAYTPRKHQANQALWKSFGLLVTDSDGLSEINYRKPIIMKWLNEIKETIGDYDLSINSISMQDDGNATSWVPTDEVYDYLRVHEEILTDLSDEGWTPRIRDAIEETKKVIDFRYKIFLSDIAQIRNDKTSNFVKQEIEKMYYIIDQPFRNWILSIKIKDNKDKKVIEWRKILVKLVIDEVETLVEHAGPRDYTGIIVTNKSKDIDNDSNPKEKSKDVGTIKNIATSYNKFNYWIKKDMNMLGGKDGKK